jgi:ribosomal protein S18 acetylase RimI-like enzyme
MTVSDLYMRPALPDDDASGLLYLSAQPYYDAYAGSAERARDMIARLFPQRGHAVSFEVCTVAEDPEDNSILGVLAAFPSAEGDRLARRFVSLSAVHIPPYRWPSVVRHLRASGRISPRPPLGCFYIDAVAVARGARRRGIARALLAEAERQARHHGASLMALETGLANEEARALYAATGFELTGERRAPDEHTARAVGGPGFASYERAVTGSS